MAGNSRRRGAIRKTGTKKGMTVGTGGHRRRSLKGKGPTPRAQDRPGHPASRRSGKDRDSDQSRRRGARAVETVAGRNAVVEALRAEVPSKTLYVADHIHADDRVEQSRKLAATLDVPVRVVPRRELDQLAAGIIHQGLVLELTPFNYAHPDDVLAAATDSGDAPLIVALDGVTDPRNLGAIIRSTAAFSGHGVVIPERRSAGMGAGAWKTSAGAAAHLPVAKATNLVRALRSFKDAGIFIVGLDGSGDVSMSEVPVRDSPLCLVVGSEGEGMSRVVRQACDVVAKIPIAGSVESLNAGVAAGIALYEIDQARHKG